MNSQRPCRFGKYEWIHKIQILTSGINSRRHVDLIDLQTQPNNELFFFNYQCH